MKSRVADVGSDYLERAAELLAPAKRLSYERMDLRPGAHVLDVGCGPGIDTVPLAACVGAGGHVSGVDRDPKMIAAANESARRAGVSARVRHYEQDAGALSFDDFRFDAVRSERLFQHLEAPDRVLAEMVRVTRPRGRVVVLDTDWGTHSIDSDDPEVERALARLMAERSLPNGYSGRRLFGLLKRGGLTDVSVEVVPVWTTDAALWRLIARLDVLQEEALARGVIDAEAMDRWKEALGVGAISGTFFGGVSLVLAAGTKP